MRDDKKSVLLMLENALDMLINAMSFIMAYIVALGFGVGYIPIFDLWVMLSVFIAVMVASFFYHFFNLYRPVYYAKENYILSTTVLANVSFYAFALLFFIGAAGDEAEHFVMLWVPMAALVSTALLIIKKRIIISLARFLHKRRYIVKKVILVGDNIESSRFFIKEVERDIGSGFMILGGVGRKLGRNSGLEKLGNFEDLGRVLDEYKPDYAVFAVDAYDKKHLIDLVNQCDDRCVKVYFLPVIYGFFKSARQVERLGDVPIINVHSTPLDNGYNAFIKRLVDIIGSLVLIILTSPIMLAAAIGVTVSSPGPILFKQQRVGKMGKPFIMYKFRSMRVNDGSTTEWTTNEDPRKTKFGNFMRKTSIDELPQLFNVLLGDMSLVGPRPEIPHFVEYFKNIIPLYMVKHYVKPGMTGLAQIKGLRGDTSVEDRIHEDISYIEHWSLPLDISILLKTPFKMVNKHEKYAINDEEHAKRKESEAQRCGEAEDESTAGAELESLKVADDKTTEKAELESLKATDDKTTFEAVDNSSEEEKNESATESKGESVGGAVDLPSEGEDSGKSDESAK